MDDWFSSSTGGQPVVTQSALWANRANFQSTGNIVRFTNVGAGVSNTGGGSFWYYTGTRWKAVGDVVLDTIDTANVGSAGTTPVNLNPNAPTIQPGVIQGFDRLEIHIGASKDAGAETCTFTLRFGPLFTNADPALWSFVLNGAELSEGVWAKFKRTSATTIQRQGSSNQQNSFGGAATGAYPTNVTVSNLDSQANMRFSLWQVMSGAVEIPTFQDLEIIYRSTDS